MHVTTEYCDDGCMTTTCIESKVDKVEPIMLNEISPWTVDPAATNKWYLSLARLNSLFSTFVMGTLMNLQ